MSSGITGIILAAGGSRRLGKPKQLLDWCGETFVAKTIKTAQASGLDPVIVITGAYREEIENEISGRGVRVVFNPDWEEGQSSSMRLGAKAAQKIGQPFMFLLCDHPQINEELIRALIDTSQKTGADIVGTKVGDRIVPPTLFQLKCVVDILELSGDRGAKSVMQKHRSVYVQWEEGLLLDCDTEDDYKKLKSHYNCA